ncbi:DNA polymerase III subunit delta [Sphingomonas oleivorans]|uniref:DNA-directed DNA polymerase n=1 Tax=Sphingomonas oleivorans TaxID=1735121 RepID=A0A2T5G2L5_9SPHN|nr:DNA polymerase III subunit delta [Sphingomonas oleivorans]PTQ13386.1 DNA polymerase III subunit delta [Sphingomonas oleivorans]
MKAQRNQIERALDTADPACRLFLLYGPDESGSRALGQRLAKAVGGDAERIDLTGAALKADPARLSDEAAAISLFGGARWIRVEPAGDEIMEAVSALLEAPSAGNPVVVLAGALRKESKLLKLALAHPAVLAFASYVPEGRDADQLVLQLAREAGLRMRPDVGRRLAGATGGDRALIAREIEKLALYVDAAPDRPGEIDHEALDALGAASEEGDLGRLVGAVFSGRPDAVDAELRRLAGEGIEGVALIRATLRRLLLLAELRAQVAAGASVDAVMAGAGRALFWKEKPEIAQQLARWTPHAIETALGRLAEAERQVKASGTVGAVAVSEELMAISRHAARLG